MLPKIFYFMLDVSGLWAADLARSPLRSRSTLRSAQAFYGSSPHRSAPAHLPAPFRYPLRSHALLSASMPSMSVSFFRAKATDQHAIYHHNV